MHPANIHQSSYDFKFLVRAHPALGRFVYSGRSGVETIDFADNKAVLALNTALLKGHYGLSDWNIPSEYLCPPIPSRADYIHHLKDLLQEDGIKSNIKGLDIGTGANAIFPILANRIYQWQMIGSDIDATAIEFAKANIKATEGLNKAIEIRHQENRANIFKGILLEKEYVHFTMCNPPFHASEDEAMKGSLRKLRNLGEPSSFKTKNELVLNFGGQANELWCNGGESLFIKRMIKESVAFKNQVGWFTTLLAKKEHLPKIYKQLSKAKADYKTIPMEQGHKKTRIIAWKFR
ncbi:23S rRNA (adenine(1618)-N(6))-methyltransferase RlmF [Winogradskyella aurantiaca]|uniref:23S rRNA (adenine(1618)-N(6))-methyltransferase RlmF n=1 Tax=Winogradskyella aurantiaca TaxID=2219558 RepID=UPI000E1D8F63|nr:23S rRNA (adenine(1618)-N(6))-methyltransferase RlmF [Winogradskyella aurantiaca]